MVKAKPVANTGAFVKEPLKLLKVGAIQKKRNPKFKNTPSGKVTLINSSKPQQNNNTMKQHKQFNKGNHVTFEKSPKNNTGNKDSPQGKNANKKSQSPHVAGGNKKLLKELIPKSEESDSDEDYNEGIIPKEDISFTEDDDVDDDEEESDDEDDDIPDIFGRSLADDSDDDDDDFDEDDSGEEEEEEDLPELKGVKMFTGIKSKNNSTDSNTTGNSTDLNSSTSSKDASFNSSIDDDDDDDDDVEDEEEDDDEDEEEDEEDEEDEEEESGLGLKALLGNSILDDDDDEDFEGEEEDDDEDDDISDEDDEEDASNNIKAPEKAVSGKAKSSPKEDAKENRTIFVGNLPVKVTKDQLIKLFKKFGPVLSVRLRGIVPIEEKIPKKVAAITKKIHPKLTSIYAYVTFQKEASVNAALSMNGKIFEGNYLRVDTTDKRWEEKTDPKKSVFLGNLSFRADNNSVWEYFKDCGEIESVRIVRENSSGVCKGIGYINFKSEDAVALALELDGTTLLNREIRVKPYSRGAAGKKKPRHMDGNKRSHPQGSDSNSPAKKLKNLSGSPVNKQNALKRKHLKEQRLQGQKTSPQGKGTFQGQKADIKKKKKGNKLDRQKKLMAAKLTAKSKKPTN